MYYILSMTLLSTEKTEEGEKDGTISIIRKTLKKSSREKTIVAARREK